MIPSIAAYFLLVLIVLLMVVGTFTRDYYRGRWQRSGGKEFKSHQKYLKIQDWLTYGFYAMLVVIGLLLCSIGYDVYVDRWTK